MTRRVGIFGGTFDPIHYGHLMIAEQAREQLNLSRLAFMPAATPPHKTDATISTPVNRVDMIRQAIASNPFFEVSWHEIDRGGVSYTADTLLYWQQRNPNDELFLIMGMDSLRDLPFWREPEKIVELATIAVACRPGIAEKTFEHEATKQLIEQVRSQINHEMRIEFITTPVMDVSSTEIRKRVADGKSVKYMLPTMRSTSSGRAVCIGHREVRSTLAPNSLGPSATFGAIAKHEPG